MVNTRTELREVEGVHILTLRGDPDVNLAHTLRMIFDELAGMEDPHLVIDMTETDTVAAAICAELILYSRKMFERGKRLRVVGGPAETRQMLGVLNTKENLLFFGGLTGALLSLPEDVRQRLDMHDRREDGERRWQGHSLGGKNRRRVERRMDLPVDIVLTEV